MQLIGLRRLLPGPIRRSMRGNWNRLLRLEQHSRELHFYRHFISRGDLVFDIGANVGDKTTAFLALGARVIAVEPNPICVERIKANHRAAIVRGQLQIECAAAACKSGKLTMRTFAGDSTMTSGSTEFLHYAKAAGQREDRTFETKALTLDSMIAEFGLPDFIKIDVEGMDADVLRGLSKQPRYLSFEFNTAEPVWQRTCECFEQVTRLGFKEANLTLAIDLKMRLRSWVSLRAALAEIKRLRERGEHWGDVFVR